MHGEEQLAEASVIVQGSVLRSCLVSRRASTRAICGHSIAFRSVRERYVRREAGAGSLAGCGSGRNRRGISRRSPHRSPGGAAVVQFLLLHPPLLCECLFGFSLPSSRLTLKRLRTLLLHLYFQAKAHGYCSKLHTLRRSMPTCGQDADRLGNTGDI